ncbi:MAG: hypothetical protein U0M06_09310 [Clostridia bacterium]|nr:hypothetical protein [Clostridia bacterium]
MKIKICSAAIIFCVIFAAIMTSCAKEKKNQGDNTLDTNIFTSTETNFPETTAEPESVSDTAPETEAITTEPHETEPDENLREPIDNEKASEIIEFQYKKATEIIEWVKYLTFPCLTDSSVTDEYGTLYYPVKDTGKRAELGGNSILTYSDLVKYINILFAPDIARTLIASASENFTEINGILCVEAKNEIPTVPEGLGNDSLFLSKFSDTMFRYTQKVSQSEETEYVDYVFENIGDRWCWTAFPSATK